MSEVQTSAAELKDLLGGASRPRLSAVARDLLDQQCVAFMPIEVDKLRAHIVSTIGVANLGIRLVGSAQLGYSTAPRKYPRNFHGESDVDVAIVSAELFDTVWSCLRNWGHPRRHRLPEEEADWMNARMSSIFWGWIDVHALHVAGVLKHKEDLAAIRSVRRLWFETFKGASSAVIDTAIAEHEVKGRLYRTEEQLIEYQAESLRRLQRELRRRDGS